METFEGKKFFYITCYFLNLLILNNFAVLIINKYDNYGQNSYEVSNSEYQN